MSARQWAQLARFRLFASLGLESPARDAFNTALSFGPIDDPKSLRLALALIRDAPTRRTIKQQLGRIPVGTRHSPWARWQMIAMALRDGNGEVTPAIRGQIHALLESALVTASVNLLISTDPTDPVWGVLVIEAAKRTKQQELPPPLKLRWLLHQARVLSSRGEWNEVLQAFEAL